MESNFLQSHWVQRRGFFLASKWRLNPKFKPATRRGLESEALRSTRLGKPNRNKARPLVARFTCRADRDRFWKARYRLKNSRISMGEDPPGSTYKKSGKNVLIPAIKKIKQETPSHKATVVGDKLVVNGKVYFHYDVPKKWLPVNSSVNTHEDYGNGTAEHQEPLQSQEESSDVMVQSQELLSQSE